MIGVFQLMFDRFEGLQCPFELNDFSGIDLSEWHFRDEAFDITDQADLLIELMMKFLRRSWGIANSWFESGVSRSFCGYNNKRGGDRKLIQIYKPLLNNIRRTPKIN